MPSWRRTCAAMPASLSEVSLPTVLLHAGSRQIPASHRGCAAACRQPASFPRVLSLQLDFAPGLATPQITPLGHFAWHVPRHTSMSLHTPTTCQHMLAHTLHTCVGLHTYSTHSCRL